MLKLQHPLCDPVVVSGDEGLNWSSSCHGAAFTAESVGEQHVSCGKLGYWVPCYPRLPQMFPCLHLSCCWPPFTFPFVSLPSPCGMCRAVPHTGHIPRAVWEGSEHMWSQGWAFSASAHNFQLLCSGCCSFQVKYLQELGNNSVSKKNPIGCTIAWKLFFDQAALFYHHKQCRNTN